MHAHWCIAGATPGEYAETPPIVITRLPFNMDTFSPDGKDKQRGLRQNQNPTADTTVTTVTAEMAADPHRDDEDALPQSHRTGSEENAEARTRAATVTAVAAGVEGTGGEGGRAPAGSTSPANASASPRPTNRPERLAATPPFPVRTLSQGAAAAAAAVAAARAAGGAAVHNAGAPTSPAAASVNDGPWSSVCVCVYIYIYI